MIVIFHGISQQLG